MPKQARAQTKLRFILGAGALFFCWSSFGFMDAPVTLSSSAISKGTNQRLWNCSPW
jgi:hypothetical protein